MDPEGNYKVLLKKIKMNSKFVCQLPEVFSWSEDKNRCSESRMLEIEVTKKLHIFTIIGFTLDLSSEWPSWDRE